jgi:hypothetical protein
MAKEWRRVPLRWIEWTEGATFGEFVWRDDRGVHFENRNRMHDGRFRDRVWPVFAPSKRKRFRVAPTRYGALIHRKSEQITRSSEIAEAKRWLCCNPLDVHAMWVEDTIQERKRGAR